jgi:hypothetical protein
MTPSAPTTTALLCMLYLTGSRFPFCAIRFDRVNTITHKRVPSIAVMLSALLALAAIHQTYAHNRLRVSLIFPTASAPNPFKLAPGLRVSRADLDYVERESIGKNRAGKTRSADRAGGERCGMSPEEFAKFYPLLIGWIPRRCSRTSSVTRPYPPASIPSQSV